MLCFDNRLVRELPGDADLRNHPRQVLGALWSPVSPTPVAAPRLIAWSREIAELLGLGERELHSPEWLAALSGNGVLPGMATYATCYGGHQFGSWANQLGDGRAIFLGEAVNTAGQRFELQLKGAGPTPYSRRADGRAVLRSSIREFLCSEAMHHLGVPTTRALSLVATGEAVVRDMFYDGHPARCSAASRRRSSASGTSNCRRRAATKPCSGNWSISPCRATSRKSPVPQRNAWRAGSAKSANARRA